MRRTTHNLRQFDPHYTPQLPMMQATPSALRVSRRVLAAATLVGLATLPAQILGAQVAPPQSVSRCFRAPSWTAFTADRS